MQLLRKPSFPLALRQMALTFELSEPTALAAGCSLIDSFRPEASAYGSQSECQGHYAKGTVTDSCINRQNKPTLKSVLQASQPFQLRNQNQTRKNMPDLFWVKHANLLHPPVAPATVKTCQSVLLNGKNPAKVDFRIFLRKNQGFCNG